MTRTLRALLDVRNRRRVGRIQHEVVVRLVDEDRDVFGDVVEQVPDVVVGDDHAGRVVRVADVDQADIAVVALRDPDEIVDVLRVVGQQRPLDHVRVDPRCRAVDGGEGGFDADDLLLVPQEGDPRDPQRLARPRVHDDVAGPHAVVLGDLLVDVAVGVAVPVRVLPGRVHRLEHLLGRAVGVLVGCELGEVVVGIGRHDAGRRWGETERGERRIGTESERAHSRGCATHEMPA